MVPDTAVIQEYDLLTEQEIRPHITLYLQKAREVLSVTSQQKDHRDWSLEKLKV